ncbi:glycosyltransferase family 2 protein [Xiashengella succiniciproducens]|jgi:hypothetical protein|uniref:Glycosyltransferase n=1 Tax=Xiashengella succiniciproducens TaxID=2949635 RepID=A0A9J6ZT07_9BACT|nr:glycosyltransferase [Alkaliflexus sp. Ai-910]URW80797.1 glycosyltransferase [Alkaliflexus sp. Ai-910]
MTNITLVITSCGRLDLLQRTIDSLWQYYQFPKDRFIIIEDSANKAVATELQSIYGQKATVIFNEKNIGLLASVDKAYSYVKTPYIFHCEDDWVFYRPGFIEESIAMLEADPKLKQVNLRSIHHDYIKNHPLDIEKERLEIAGTTCYKVRMPENFDKSGIKTQLPLHELDWSCFSFNPGVVRLKDYAATKGYKNIAESEAEISSWYKKRGYYMVVLENDAVLHIGWGHSLEGHDPKTYSFSKRLRNFVKAGLNIFGANWKYEKG